MREAEQQVVDAMASVHPLLRRELDDLYVWFAPDDPGIINVLHYFACCLGRESTSFSDEQIAAVADIVERCLRSPDYPLNDAVAVGFCEGLSAMRGDVPGAQRIIERLGPVGRGACLSS